MKREVVNVTVIRPGANFLLEWRKAGVVVARQVRAKKKRDG